MADLTELKNIVRKGIVQSVDTGAMKARVKFPDKGGIISGDLHILVRPRAVVTGGNDRSGNRTAGTSLTYDKNDTARTENHSHAEYITKWTPAVGSMVLCLLIPDGERVGSFQ